AGRADLGDQQVPAVARLLGRREALWRLDGQAVRLPLQDPAGHVHDVRIAELLEQVRAAAGSRAAAALHDDLGPLVGHRGGDLLLERAERDEQGCGNVPGVPLDLLANVDQGRARVVPGPGLRWADLTNGGWHRSLGSSGLPRRRRAEKVHGVRPARSRTTIVRAGTQAGS